MPDSIPGTTPISLETIHSGSEIFAFGISRNRQPSYLQDFITNLDTYLPSVILSKTHISTFEKRLADGLTTSTLLKEAENFLQKTRKDNIEQSGELGEVLLYIFAKEVKGANKLVSKFMNRERRSSNILGRDSIFGFRANNGDIYMLMGESKIRADGNDALREAQQSINDFWNRAADINHEIQLASSHIRDEIDEQNIDIYEAYFVEGSEQHQNLKYKNIIFVGYNFTSLQDLMEGKLNDESFKNAIETDLKRCFSNQQALIEACAHPGIYCFLPFANTVDARLFFAQHHNLIIV